MSRYLILILAAVGIILTFRFLLPLVLPFVLAYIFAKMLSPAIHWTTKKLHWNRKFSSIFIVVLSVLALGGFLAYVLITLTSQAVHLLQKIPVYQQIFEQGFEDFCCRCDRVLNLADGTSFQYVENRTLAFYEEIGNNVIPAVSEFAMRFLGRGAELVAGVFIFFLSTLLILLDDTFPRIHGSLRKFAAKFRHAGFAYIKSQVIIIFIIAVVTSCGLYFMGNDYAVLLGVCIAVFDAFPVVGSGVILIPWCLFKVLGGDWFSAAILITIFVVATFLREVMEPKLFAKDIGLKPLLVLISVYAGVKLFQIGGVILGPVALTILKTINEALKENERESQ